MQVILLERIAGLGQMGEEVRVRDGFARNYLLPQNKALRATDSNRSKFESQRAQLEARNLERKQEAEKIAGSLNGRSFIIVRQAGETGQLYGSVTTRDLAEAITADGVTIGRNQIALNQPIKTIGLHSVAIALHPEVDASITVNIARSADEAERQARGEDLSRFNDEEGEEAGEREETAGEEEEIGAAQPES